MRNHGFPYLLLFMGWQTVIAQTTDPWSVRYPVSPLSSFVYLAEPVEDIEKILAEENTQLKTWVFAAGVETDITPSTSGQWDTIPGTGYVWRTAVRTENALCLDLLLKNFRLGDNESLHVYNELQTSRYSFTQRDNRPNEILPVAALKGSGIVIEWNIPERKDAYPFTVSNIGYGFRNPQPDRVRMSADRCNVDINCRSGNRWQLEKRAVVYLQTKGKDGKGLSCSGVLVNQTGKTKKPYILTAGHCISDEDMAAKSVFTFEYEKISCGSDIAPDKSKTISGSQLIAYKKELDFALVELSTDIPTRYRPYYAGWTLTSQDPLSGTGIHHPKGDVKKISVDTDPLTSGTFDDGILKCDNNAHLTVTKWDEGVTEEGSSGSPVFNEAHYAVGTLTGGKAKCGNPVNDQYSKISRQWNSYPADSTSLKKWLDPEKTGVNSLYGYDPLTNYEGPLNTMSNIGDNEGKTTVATDRWGVITGHNDKEWNTFAEKIHNDTVATIIGIEADIAQIYSQGSRVRFSVWTGADYPSIEQWGKDFFLTKEYRNFPFRIYFDNVLTLTEDYFIGFEIYYDRVDTFSLCQSVRRPYEGISSLYVRDGYTWKALNEDTPPTYASLAVKAIGKFGKKQEEFNSSLRYNELKVIFQPNSDLLFAYIENPTGNVVVECFDVSGRLMYVDEVQKHYVMPDNNLYLQLEINIRNLSSGMYILRVTDRNQSYSGKFLKVK
ncbi:MAG: trypsin-like peptidase domain-containing protein [Bacteroidales bacterium]|jgi:hypothetical protein|nr:trypsin-like peptidase domain-containing protein [Bacteroidales bacterium]